MLPISEIFGKINTLQGEGIHMGVPSVFVRTALCNLTCKGFGCKEISPKDGSTILGCDSIHSVSTHFKQEWTQYTTFNELVNDILEHINNEDRYAEKQDIIFTGGEPLLHHKDEVLINVIEYFISRGHRVFFETNATIEINFDEYPIYKQVQFSMSVKMSNSGEPIHKRWRPEVANSYLKNTKGSYFKFVLTKEQALDDAPEVFEFLEQVPTFGLVYCMPMGEIPETVQENAKDVYEFCAKHGFRYSDRLHIRIYGSMRGV